MTPAAQTEVFQLCFPFYISGVKFTETFDDALDSNNHILQFADSHFHLDLLLKRTSHSNFRHLESDLQDLNFQFVFGIANYVYQDYWCHLEQHVNNDPIILTTVGIHPHLFTSIITSLLYQRLKNFSERESVLDWERLAWTTPLTANVFLLVLIETSAD